MRRTLAYVAAFTGMATLFLVTILVTALVLNAITPRAAGVGQGSPSATPSAAGPVGEIRITAFDLGFEPAMVHVAEPGRYTVTFVNDGGTFHDVTFADGTVIGADGRQSASGEVAIGPDGMSFICSVPGHADGGMRGEVMVDGAAASGDPQPTPSTRTAEEMRDIDAAVTAQFPALRGV